MAVMNDVMSKQLVADAAELETYRKFVEAVAQMADGKPIFNRSPAHAAVVVEYIIGGASEKIDIITGRLYEQVYGVPTVVEAAMRFLRSQPTASMRILSEELIAPNHPLLSAIKSAGFQDRVSMKVLPKEIAASTPYHFALADSNSFRFESDKTQMEAVVQFGKDDIGRKLDITFNRLWDSTT
jgi:hypothetical protein